MGLPLFIAPVETDLPLKDVPKRNVLSPSRGTIRRSTQTETREQRNSSRRAGARIVSLQPHSRPTRSHPPWTLDESPRHPTPPLYDDEEPSSGPTREVLRDVTSRSPRSDRHLEDRMSTLFGGTWHSIGPPPSQRNDDAGPEGDFWWNVETQQRRARIVAPDSPRRNRSPHQRRAYQVGTPPYPPTRDGSERRQSESATPDDDDMQQHALASFRSLRRDQVRTFRTLTTGDAAGRNRQRTHATDGLGDRDRSLSPEVWDTLLTTLTPDPQPPSASSSFASAAASQSAGPSNVPPSAPALPDEAADGACESGHEMSDDEEDLYSRYPRGAIGFEPRLRRHPRRNRSVPDYNLDGPSDGPSDEPLNGPPSRRSEASRTGQNSGDSRTNGYALLLTNSWLTHAGPEDERGVDRLRPNREGSAGSGPGAQTGDEDWLGMRRIVQSLAAREDIPDEWWAEAGLSRTLPHDESN